MVEVISKTIQTDTNLLKKEFGVLKEETRCLSDMTRSTEQNFEKVQSNVKESLAALERGQLIWLANFNPSL